MNMIGDCYKKVWGDVWIDHSGRSDNVKIFGSHENSHRMVTLANENFMNHSVDTS